VTPVRRRQNPEWLPLVLGAAALGGIGYAVYKANQPAAAPTSAAPSGLNFFQQSFLNAQNALNAALAKARSQPATALPAQPAGQPITP